VGKKKYAEMEETGLSLITAETQRVKRNYGKLLMD
jgi:hypothetical protein